MAQRGRPSRLTKELQAQICECLMAGAHHRFAAAKVGIDETLFSRWYHRGAGEDRGIYREFFLAVNAAEAEFEQSARELLRSAAAVNPSVALKWLARRFPHEYGRRDNVEEASVEDKAAQAQQMRQMLIERLEKLAPEPQEAAAPPADAPDAE